MSEDNIHYDIDSRGVATLTLARPKKLNALTPRMMDDVMAYLETSREGGVRALVMTGEGTSFCAGMDIEAEGEDGVIERVKDLFAAIDGCPVATIARVHGYAMGGGLGMASATDFVIASDDARFGMPELRIGMAPFLVSVYASRRLGWGAARRWALSASHVSAQAAARDGFVDRLAAPGEIDREVEHVLADILKTAPEAAKAAKRFFQERSSVETDVVRQALNLSAKLAEQNEARSGAAAFYNRETPPWAR